MLGVSDLLMGAAAAGRKSLSKPFHKSIKLVRGTNRSNGLPMWLLKMACSRIFQCQTTTLDNLTEPEGVYRLLDFACQLAEGQTVDATEQLPEYYVEWLVNLAKPMELVIKHLTVTVELDWTKVFGFFPSSKRPRTP